jgi:hypothetical protein
MTHDESLIVIYDLWDTISLHLSSVEIQDAAHAVVSVLVDTHGFSPKDIAEHFQGVPEIEDALSAYSLVTNEWGDVDSDFDEDDEDYIYENCEDD